MARRDAHELRTLAATAAAIVAGLVWLSAPSGVSRATSDARDSEGVLRELVVLLQGEAVPVEGSPAICHGGGAPSAEYAQDAAGWYFSKGACQLRYPPNPLALVRTVSERGWPELYTHADTVTRMTGLLQKLQREARGRRLTLQQKLLIQSTAWEITFGLQALAKRDETVAKTLQPVLSDSLRLLSLTLFSSDELAQLPATLPDLPKLASAPEIAPAVGALLRHDPHIVEVLLPSELHADLLFGRFTARIFLTLTSEAQVTSFVEYIRSPETPYEALRELPLRFPGLQAILLLVFNVLTRDFTVMPTEQVAFWQQYTISGTTSLDLPFAEVAERIQFLTLRYEDTNLSPESGVATKGNGVRAFRYTKADPNEMTRGSALDVKPGDAGQRVTTLRGHCLGCHRNLVTTFDTYHSRSVDFAAPLVRRGRDLLTPHYTEEIEPKLRQWAAAHGIATQDTTSEP